MIFPRLGKRFHRIFILSNKVKSNPWTPAILGEKEVRFFSHIRSFRMTLRNLFSVIPNEVRNLNAFQIHRELLPGLGFSHCEARSHL
jgi:hypothetical protein